MSAINTASRIYDLFAAGDVPGIDALCAQEYYAQWNGDEGMEESHSFMEFAGKTFTKIAKYWPGFHLTPIKAIPSADGLEAAVILEASFRPGAPVPTTQYLHYWRVNQEGLCVEWRGFDDGYALNKNKLPEGETYEAKNKTTPVPANLAAKVSTAAPLQGAGASEVAGEVFERFSAGDMPGILSITATPEEGYTGTWIGDKGVQSFNSFEEVLGGVIGRIPSTWPGFGIDVVKRIESKNRREAVTILKTKFRVGAPVSSGYICDYMRVNEEGKVEHWTGFHDYNALVKNALVDKDISAKATTSNNKVYAATNLEYKDHPSFPNSRMVQLGPGKLLVEWAKGTRQAPVLHSSDLTWILTRGSVKVGNPATKEEVVLNAPATWTVPSNTPHTATALTEAQFIGQIHGPVDMKPWTASA